MPRPTRKPKRFNPSKLEGNVEVPVVSTPLHPSRSTTNPPPPASPELSPIQRENDFTIYNDTMPESDDFGFSKVKGVKKAVVLIHIDSDVDDEADDEIDDKDNDSVKQAEDDEDIYGEQIISTTAPEDFPSPVKLSAQPPKKPIRNKLRTSQLLPLLPARRKRQVSKKATAVNTSDEGNVSVEPTKLGKKRRAVDKENDVPEAYGAEIDSQEEQAMEERREIVKTKFAEVDQWEMAFETVDWSFSSQ